MRRKKRRRKQGGGGGEGEKGSGGGAVLSVTEKRSLMAKKIIAQVARTKEAEEMGASVLVLLYQ